jgi:hypothetical protein
VAASAHGQQKEWRSPRHAFDIRQRVYQEKLLQDNGDVLALPISTIGVELTVHRVVTALYNRLEPDNRAVHQTTVRQTEGKQHDACQLMNSSFPNSTNRVRTASEPDDNNVTDQLTGRYFTLHTTISIEVRRYRIDWPFNPYQDG